MITPLRLWSESPGFPLLTVMALIPFAGMMVVASLEKAMLRIRIGMAFALISVLMSAFLLFKYDDGFTGVQFAEQFSLLGLNYSVGIDGISVLFFPLVAISILLAFVYLSATNGEQNGRMAALLLGYQAILTAAFSALNLLQFWLMTFLELLPIVLAIGKMGFDRKKRHLLVRLAQFLGSSLLMTLSGFSLLAFGLIDSEHELTFDLLTLSNNNAYLHDETLIFVLLFYGFAIRMPLFPFHGWLPLLAEQAGLANIAILLVGVKLGIYGMIRFIFPLVPGVAEQWADYVLILCIVSIFYGALLAFMQSNAYRLLAFATLTHTAMLVFGVFSFNAHGLEGTLLLSLVYGLASVGMFFSIGFIHEHTHTAFIPRLGGLFDSHTALALLFLITTLSTVIMPGSLGFDAGHLLLDGVVEEHEWGISIVILAGHVLNAGFLLWAFQRIFLAESKRPNRVLPADRTLWQEWTIAFIVCALHIGTGLNSMPLLRLIEKDVGALVSQYPIHSTQSTEMDGGDPAVGENGNTGDSE